MNPQEIQALREKRTKLIADARTLNDTATADTPLSAEDDATVRKMLKDARAIASQVERDEELAQEEGATLPESQRSETDDAPAGDQSSETAEERQRYSAALRSYLRDGLQEISADDRKMLRAGYVEFQGDEKRAHEHARRRGGRVYRLSGHALWRPCHVGPEGLGRGGSRGR